MIEIPGRIPILIHPLFWVLAVFIGWMNSASVLGIFIWVVIVFVSVLVHELGHAISAIACKQTARIQLIALGGVTTYEGPPLNRKQQFAIVFAGPLFGFFLCVLATILLRFVPSQDSLWFGVLKVTQLANLFWSVVNLLPVLPLDGGQLLRIVLEGMFGVFGFRLALALGGVISGVIALFFLMRQDYLIGALFFLFAFEGLTLFRKSRHVTQSDQEETNKLLLAKAEALLQEGHKTEAKAVLEELQAKAHAGMLAKAAAEILAHLLAEEGKREEAYAKLLPHHDDLSDDTKCLMHQLAMEFHNYAIVAELSRDCYQMIPSQEIALRNARAFAHLGEPRLAGGWLKAAWQHGGLDLDRTLSEPTFDQVRDLSEFKKIF
ncbi:MAG: hypothetical protein RL235_1098 [Chlamydiota bacterium]|jgi:Zn-dependent protease